MAPAGNYRYFQVAVRGLSPVPFYLCIHATKKKSEGRTMTCHSNNILSQSSIAWCPINFRCHTENINWGKIVITSVAQILVTFYFVAVWCEIINTLWTETILLLLYFAYFILRVIVCYKSVKSKLGIWARMRPVSTVTHEHILYSVSRKKQMPMQTLHIPDRKRCRGPGRACLDCGAMATASMRRFLTRLATHTFEALTLCFFSLLRHFC